MHLWPHRWQHGCIFTPAVASVSSGCHAPCQCSTVIRVVDFTAMKGTRARNYTNEVINRSKAAVHRQCKSNVISCTHLKSDIAQEILKLNKSCNLIRILHLKFTHILQTYFSTSLKRPSVLRHIQWQKELTEMHSKLLLRNCNENQTSKFKEI